MIIYCRVIYKKRSKTSLCDDFPYYVTLQNIIILNDTMKVKRKSEVIYMDMQLENISKLLFKYQHMEQSKDNQIIIELLEEKEKKLIHEYLK